MLHALLFCCFLPLATPPNSPTLPPMTSQTIDESSAWQRLDRYLRKYFKHTPEISLGDIFSRLRKWSIKVNRKKKKQNYRLVEWDVIEWDERIVTNKKAWEATKPKSAKITDTPLADLQAMLLYEDEHRLVRNKPPQILIHPWDKHTTDITLHDLMVSYLKQTDQRNATQTYSPSFCYRLDKDTSWVVISAKTYASLQYLNEQIRERKTNKRYMAVLVGDMSTSNDTITVDEPLFVWYNRKTWRSQTFINREKGKESKTDFMLQEVVDHPVLWPISLVHVKIYTWRMHQIRAHAAHIWYPVLWDLTYGIPAINRRASKKMSITRQLLHASTYWFFDIFGDTKRVFDASLPDVFRPL